jgi:RNA polymerase sigma factor (sigma-70 family)
MNVHISYKVPKNPSIESEINQHINKLAKRLQVFRPELVHLRGVIENGARQGFSVSLDLKLPSGDIAARENGPNHTSALKAVFDDLLERVTKHKDHLRNEYKWPRRRRVGRQRPQPQVPFEETLAAVHPATVSDADIASYVNANLQRLRRFVERELRYRESLTQLRPGELSADEVIDEAIASALGENGEKPDVLALEAWLYRLAIQAIDEVCRRSREDVQTVPLEEPARRPNYRASYEPQLQYHQPDEDIVKRDIIPDPRLATPEATAASDEMITLVEAALLSASREDREAFLLFAIEGFTVEEIAAISDRRVDQVRASIAAAREHLQKNLPMPNEFKDKLLQQTKIA